MTLRLVTDPVRHPVCPHCGAWLVEGPMTPGLWFCRAVKCRRGPWTEGTVPTRAVPEAREDQE
jgi:hypothetical protein